MSTYGEMQTNIANILRRSDLGTEIPIAIKRAIKFYEQENWPWQEVRDTTLTTTADQKTVDLPSDFGYEVSLTTTVSDYTYPVRKTTLAYLEKLYISSNVTQWPTLYAIFDDDIYLYPIPDDSYALVLAYYQNLTTLSNSSDSNAWTTTAEEMIESHALWWLASKVMRNQELAGSYKTAERLAYQQLQRSYTMKKSSGRIRPSHT